MRCQDCEGNGYYVVDVGGQPETRRCEDCAGSGEVVCPHDDVLVRMDGNQVGWVTCQKCGEENTPELIQQAKTMSEGVSPR